MELWFKHQNQGINHKYKQNIYKSLLGRYWSTTNIKKSKVSNINHFQNQKEPWTHKKLKTQHPRQRNHDRYNLAFWLLLKLLKKCNDLVGASSVLTWFNVVSFTCHCSNFDSYWVKVRKLLKQSLPKSFTISYEQEKTIEKQIQKNKTLDEAMVIYNIKTK